MQGSGWLSVLSRIPAQKHDCLIIVTNTGAEIVLREIVRVENDFMILRGRMAGSADEGRVIIMPFDQVTYLAFNKMMPEAELQAMFGKSASTVKWLTVEPPPPADAAIAVAPVAERPEGPPAAQEAVAAPAAAQGADAPRSEADPGQPAVPAGGKVPPRPAHPSKSLLLARLRARLANEGGNPLPR